MKNLTAKHRFVVEEAISRYIKSNDAEKLIKSLTTLENAVKREIKGKNKSMWFKFFKGDTLATDIQDIEATLNRGTEENKEYLLDCLTMAVCSGEIQIYYS